MTNHGNVLSPGQFEQLSSLFGVGQDTLSRTIRSLTSQVHSGVWHVFFAQLLSKNKVQRTSESTIQTVWEGDKTGTVLMRENNGGKFQWITLHLFSRTPCEISCAFLELVFLSLLLGRYQDFVICVAAGSKGFCCLPHLTVTSAVKNSSHFCLRLLGKYKWVLFQGKQGLVNHLSHSGASIV